VADPFVIDVSNLKRRYGAAEVLHGLNVQVPAGSIFGFLGRNGAGKTTTIKILLGMTRPSSGSVQVFGLRADDPDSSVEIRRRTGFVSEDKDLYDWMTVDEIIRFTASLYPRWRRDLEERYQRLFELPRGSKVKQLSRGTRTKLALLLAFCRGADLLVLDEPTSGLDPTATEEVLQALVAQVANGGLTVFFSSHHIAEVDQIADRIAIIDRGRAIVAGALDDLRDNFRRIQFVFDGDAPQMTFRAPGVMRMQRTGRVLTVVSSAAPGPIVDEGRACGAVSADVVPITLKEIFLESVAAEDGGSH
jgi:ABC-2 type transport system ATP-binding protein